MTASPVSLLGRYNRRMDTIRKLAEERHFHTAEIEIGGYGRAVVIGDEDAVARIRQLIAEHDDHDLVEITTPVAQPV